MKWASRQLVLPVVVGLSCMGVSAALLYLLFKKDDESNDTRRTRIETSRQTIVELRVPRQFVPAVIGRCGATIKHVQSSTETRINFTDDNVEIPERICLIRGSPEGVRLAEAMLKNIIANQPIIETYEVFVPQRACGRIIGRGGENIQQIQNCSNAKVIVESGGRSSDPNAETRIIIKGSAEQIAAALSLVQDKVREENEAREKLEASVSSRLPRGKVSPRNSANHGTESQHHGTESLASQGSDGLMEVYVSAMETPSLFWVQVIGPGAVALDGLVNEMTAYYEDEENRELHRLKKVTVGQMVAAKFNFDDNWYRAEVISELAENSYLVYFADYGDSQEMNADNILELRTDFLSLRLQAIECSLASVKPRDGEWSQEACERFSELSWLAQWKVLIAKVRGYKERVLGRGRSRREGSPIPCVDLYDKNDNADVNIAQELINGGFAEAEEGSWSASSSTVSLPRRHNHDSPPTPVATPPLIPEIDLTTPRKASGFVEEIDLVTPVKTETTNFIALERKIQEQNGSGDNLRNGNTNGGKFERGTKLLNVSPGGYEDEFSGDSDEMELG